MDWQLSEVERIAVESGLGLRIENWETMHGGVSGLTAKLQLADGTVGVARRPSRHSTSNLEGEFQTYIELEYAGIPTAIPIAIVPEANLFITSFCEGSHAFQPRDAETYSVEVGKALAEIHSLQPSSLEPILPKTSMPLDPNWRPELTKSIQNYNLKSNEIAFSHGDLWPGNLLFRDDKLSAVLDWENAKFAPPLYDLAIARMDAYIVLGRECTNKLTETYFNTSGRDQDDLSYWDIRAVTRLDGYHSHCAPAYSTFGRPEIDAREMRSRCMEFWAEADKRLP